jgi:anti-sigma B factor antagonist
VEGAVFEVRADPGPDGVVVVHASGEVDMTVSALLERTLLDAVRQDGARQVLVDLAGLRFLDSSGVHALVRGYQAANDAGNVLVVRNATGVVARVLYITGVAEALGLPVVDETEEYPRGA